MNVVERSQSHLLSAEALAISRLQDEGHANQWTTLVEAEEKIDLEEGLAYLKKRSYKVQIPDQNT